MYRSLGGHISSFLAGGRSLVVELTGHVVGKKSACSAGVTGVGGSLPGRGSSPGSGHSNTLQCSSLEDPVNRGAWWAAVHRVTKS